MGAVAPAALPERGPSDPESRRQRWRRGWDAPRVAIATLFLLDGLAFGAWVAHLPLLQRGLALSDVAFSGVLAGVVIGAFISQPLAGILATRIGTRRVTRPGAVLAGLALALPAFAPTLGTLLAAAAVFGLVRGTMEVPMNAQAALLETRHAKPRMSSFHACFSLGGALGAGLAAVLLRTGLGARASLSLVGVACALIAAVAGRHLITDHPEAATSESSAAPTPVAPNDVLRDTLLLALGALAFCGLFGEGAMADWSALLLVRTTAAAPAAAALGYAAFSVAMTLGRLTGDSVVARAGGARTLRVSGVLAASGMSLALLAPQLVSSTRSAYALALVGCAVVGFGYANLVPILYSASARRAGSAGVAAVSTLGYSGFVVGPPAIGGLSVILGSLPAALGVVAMLALGIAAGAGLVGRASALVPDATAPESADDDAAAGISPIAEGSG